MTAPRFLQIHTLQSYTAALLNRDDSGLAKRLPYGGALRTRISSQCLKRHWRMADTDPHSLNAIDGAEPAYRSRELVKELVIGPLKGLYSEDIVDVIEKDFQIAVYGNKGDKGKKSRQTLLFGKPETDWLASQARSLADEASDADDAAKRVEEWAKDFKDNIKAMRNTTALPYGLTAALFGRMVTSDPEANIEAPVYVAHAFTVHAEEAEGDYFTAVDDLDDLNRDDDDSGADHIGETELTSGLFYGYVVVDLPGLIKNCGGQRDLAAKVVHNLTHLIAEVSPGAKRGSTAPFGRADLMLVEAGERQPRSLATAFRQPVAPDREAAIEALDRHLVKLDKVYATGEARRYLSLADTELTAPEGGDFAKVYLPKLAQWAAEQVVAAPDAANPDA